MVYSLLDGHPASGTCEQFIRTHSGWFTTTLTLLETKAVLTKVYGVDSSLATQKLSQFAAGPIAILSIDVATVLSAMHTADSLRVDLTDAALLQAVQAQGATRLTTDDRALARACREMGITPENPIDADLRQEMVVWEADNLPTRGLPRFLRQLYQWLHRHYPEVAQDFWSQTGGGSHLP
ncbi:MAG: hypothetical protein ETSY2_45005 [Candidatus Entotheonella gemina]|uniref:PIN domain-containing protein n=2 Tax=Candidatus Entotheonella TaxID=93171 RepID=W4LH22_9BACT|nr:MAG: hypothetical protein ETSY2_45005 [Candidatus Entotheonella gemina]